MRDEVLRWLVANGINESYGARPLLALMNRKLEGALGRVLLAAAEETTITGQFVPAAGNSDCVREKRISEGYTDRLRLHPLRSGNKLTRTDYEGKRALLYVLGRIAYSHTSSASAR